MPAPRGMPARQVLAQMAASSGLGFGVAAALASVSASPLGAFLAAGAGLAFAWVLVNRTGEAPPSAADADHWPPADDDGTTASPPRLANEESLWARLAENAGSATTLH